MFPEVEKGPLLPLFVANKDLDRTKDVDYYICDYSLKCEMGIYNHNAFHINCHEKGETIGSGEGVPEEELSMKIEGAELKPKHCKILYNKDRHEYYLELCTPDAEIWVQINKTIDLREYFLKENDVLNLQCGSYKFEITQIKKNVVNKDINSWLIENHVVDIRPKLNELGIKTVQDLVSNSGKLKPMLNDCTWGQLSDVISNMKIESTLNVKYYKTNPSDVKEEQINNTKKLEIPPTPDIKKPAPYTISKFNNSFKINLNETHDKQKKLYRKIRNAEKYKLSPDDELIISKLTFKVQRLNTGVYTDKGHHTENEDTYICIQNLNVLETLMVSFHGIFDGYMHK